MSYVFKNKDLAQSVKRALRDKYAWPGGYPLFIVMADGGALSIEAARAEWRQIAHAMLVNDKTSGWLPFGVDVNWEDPELYCDHTGERIESAYAEDDAAMAQEFGYSADRA